MLKDDNEILFQYSNNGLLHLYIQIISLIWIGFALYKFNLNPTFFSISILIAFLILITNYKTKIIARSKFIEIKKLRIIPFMNNTKKYNYSDIYNLKIDKQEYSVKYELFQFLASSIPNFIGPSQKENRVILTLTNQLIVNIEFGFDSNQFDIFTNIIKKQMI